MYEKYYEKKTLARLIPPELVARFHLPDPGRSDFPGLGTYFLETDPNRPGFSLRIVSDPSMTDPLFIVKLNISHLGNLEIAWIAANDPDSERFDVDLLGRLPLEPKSGLRNMPEELRAMRAGLMPNQVRKGLHILKQAVRCVEDYAHAAGAEFLSIFPMEYHNALAYEACGFSYRSGEELMRSIDEGFRPGGRLAELLTGETPFRENWMADTVLGRSWAIHDGIMGSGWYAPEMYKAAGTKTKARRSPPVPWQ